MVLMGIAVVQLTEGKAGEKTLGGEALDAMLAAVDYAQQRGVAKAAPALWFNGALQHRPSRRSWQQLLAYSMQTELPRLQVGASSRAQPISW